MATATLFITAGNDDGHQTLAGEVDLTNAEHVSASSLIFGSAGSGDGEFNNPNGIAVDTDGSIYVADSSNHRIQVFDSTGAFVDKWGSNGSGDGEFNSPVGVALSGGYVYVTDAGNSRVQKFDTDGAFVGKWGSSGAGDGEFAIPAGITISAADEVYVIDSDNNRIQVFDTAGTFLRKWGSVGGGDGEFDTPWGIAISAAGDVYVGDSANTRIQVFDSVGTFVRKWGSSGSGDGQFGNLPGIALSATGSVYVIDPDNHRMQVFTSDGVFKRKWGTYGNGNGQFNNPYGMAISAAGDLYVADTGNHRVQVFDLYTLAVSYSYPTAGLLFRTVPIPQGATVRAAVLGLAVFSPLTDDPGLVIRGEIAPADFTTTTNDLSDRAKTAAGVAWSAAGVYGGEGMYVDTPDLAAVIQEIVDYPSWVANDDLALYLLDDSTGGVLLFRPYEFDTAALPARLFVEWAPLIMPEPEVDLTFAWPTDYWGDGYWAEYWPDYGTGTPPAAGVAAKWLHYQQMRRRRAT